MFLKNKDTLLFIRKLENENKNILFSLFQSLTLQLVHVLKKTELEERCLEKKNHVL